MKNVYLDNAATTFPKPTQVIRAVNEAMLTCSNPGRGSYALAEKAEEIVYDCREAAAELFSCEAENISFTMNATQALNMAIKGLVRRGDHILIDNIAHNASFRPVEALCTSNENTYDVYDFASPDSVREKIRENTSVCVATHSSNISSDTSDIEKIGEICRDNGIKFVVDGAQSAGHIPIDMKNTSITSLCLPGHKGLFGPMGVGMLLSSPDAEYGTIIEGGAGINSLDKVMPEELPERLEAGTLPLPAIAGLCAGIKYVSKTGICRIREHEIEMTKYILSQMPKDERIHYYGSCDGSVFGFTLDGLSPAEIGRELSRDGICTRVGYHCAPMAHKTFGSIENGSVRVSVSYMTKRSDADAFLASIGRIMKIKQSTDK